MTALERLISNCNAVIGFLKNFSSSTAEDVQFEWINDDDSTEIITFANIKKFQASVNVFRDSNGNFVDQAGAPIAIDATTLNGRTAAEIGASTGLRFTQLLDVNAGCFSERWMWAVTDNNELIHFGRGDHGVSGDIGLAGDNLGYRVVPQPASKKGVAIRQIIATTWAGYVLYEDGDLYGTGHAPYGQLGQGNTATQTNLVFILDNVESFASSSHGRHQDHNTLIAIKTNGSVWSWGRNAYGQCGNGNTTTQLSPGERSISNLLDGERVVKAYVCDTHVISTYLLTDQGRVFAAGWNGDGGALGLGDTENRHVFELVSGELSGKQVVSLSVAGGTRENDKSYYRHSVTALTNEGELFSWGYNGNSELGLGNTTNYNIPQQVFISEANGKFVKVIDSFGSWTSRFALTDTGELWGWGKNKFGCLGITDENQPTPFKITLINEDDTENTSGVKDAMIISSGTYSYHHSSFVTTNDGKIFSAGYSDNGQLGGNTTSNQSSFKEIRFAFADQIKQLSFGGYSSASTVWVLLTDGRIFAWGDNDYQQAVTSVSSDYVTVPQLTIQ